jgi:hypothetical protein
MSTPTLMTESRVTRLAAFTVKAASNEATPLQLVSSPDGTLNALLPKEQNGDELHVLIEGQADTLIGASINNSPVHIMQDGPDSYRSMWQDTQGEFIEDTFLKRQAEQLGIDTSRTIDLHAYIRHNPYTRQNTIESFKATSAPTNETLKIEVGREVFRQPPSRPRTTRGIKSNAPETRDVEPITSSFTPDLVGYFVLRVIPEVSA